MVAINIPADGFFLAIQKKANGDFSERNCERIISDYVDKFLEASPDVLLLNVCYRRALTPSEVFDSYLYDIETDENGFAVKNASGKSQKNFSPTTDGVSKYFMSFVTCARELMKNQIDIYKIAIRRIRKSGCRVFLSIRMNDGHYTDNPAINSSFAMKNGGAHTIDRDGAYLDFSQKAVQNYYFSYIEELVSTYAVDGIELDWLRFPPVLPKEKRTDFHILGSFMKEVRAFLDRHGKDVCLAVRLFATEEENLAEGFDAAVWIAEGSVDLLTVENFYIPTNFEIPIEAWRGSIDKRNKDRHAYRLLCGSDWAVSCVARYSIAITPALVRGFTETCLDRGADGVYLFNFFEENDTSSFELVVDDRGAHLENCFLSRMKAAKMPQELPRRYVHIGNSNKRYPILLHKNESYAFEKRIAHPSPKCRIVIGCETKTDLSVLVNGHSVQSIHAEPIFEGFEFVPEDEIGKKNHFIYALTQAAPIVYSAALPMDLPNADKLFVEIRNSSCEAVKILWLEIVCE